MNEEDLSTEKENGIWDILNVALEHYQNGEFHKIARYLGDFPHDFGAFLSNSRKPTKEKYAVLDIYFVKALALYNSFRFDRGEISSPSSQPVV